MPSISIIYTGRSISTSNIGLDSSVSSLWDKENANVANIMNSSVVKIFSYSLALIWFIACNLINSPILPCCWTGIFYLYEPLYSLIAHRFKKGFYNKANIASLLSNKNTNVTNINICLFSSNYKNKKEKTTNEYFRLSPFVGMRRLERPTPTSRT